MKLYYFYTLDSETILLKNLFESNIPDDFDKKPQIYNDVNFCKKNHGGGYLGWLCKYNTIMKAFEETEENEYFIFSDIDVIFYKSFLDNIKNIINDNQDILFQMENIKHDVNIGFMIIKNSNESKNFWEKASNLVESNKYIDDDNCYKIKHKRGCGSGQFLINDLLYSQNHGIKWSRLPVSFWSRSIGMESLNENIYLHHANCTNTIEKKIDQIEDIKNKFLNKNNSVPNILTFGNASISKSEFDIIDNLVKKYNINTVLEFGTGSSTYAFIQNNCSIISVETDQNYINKYKNIYNSYSNIEFLLNDQKNILNIKNVLANKYFDLGFIDGPRADLQQYKLFNRIDSYVLASMHCKYILCHDSNRSKDRNSINLMFDKDIYNIKEFKSDRGLTLIYKK